MLEATFDCLIRLRTPLLLALCFANFPVQECNTYLWWEHWICPLSRMFHGPIWEGQTKGVNASTRSHWTGQCWHSSGQWSDVMHALPCWDNARLPWRGMRGTITRHTETLDNVLQELTLQSSQHFCLRHPVSLDVRGLSLFSSHFLCPSVICWNLTHARLALQGAMLKKPDRHFARPELQVVYNCWRAFFQIAFFKMQACPKGRYNPLPRQSRCAVCPRGAMRLGCKTSTNPTTLTGTAKKNNMISEIWNRDTNVCKNHQKSCIGMKRTAM